MFWDRRFSKLSAQICFALYIFKQSLGQTKNFYFFNFIVYLQESKVQYNNNNQKLCSHVVEVKKELGRGYISYIQEYLKVV